VSFYYISDTTTKKTKIKQSSKRRTQAIGNERRDHRDGVKWRNIYHVGIAEPKGHVWFLCQQHEVEHTFQVVLHKVLLLPSDGELTNSKAGILIYLLL